MSGRIGWMPRRAGRWVRHCSTSAVAISEFVDLSIEKNAHPRI
jgi:hypothetical protein